MDAHTFSYSCSSVFYNFASSFALEEDAKLDT